MKKILLTAVALVLLGFGAFTVDTADAAVRVRGYFRKNGTYVQPHYRSNPDGNPYNNWSFPGNTNPYTGKTATGNPDTYLRNYYNRGSGSSSLNSYASNAAPSTSLVPVNPVNYLSAYQQCQLRFGPNTHDQNGACYCNAGWLWEQNSCISLLEWCGRMPGARPNVTNTSCECQPGLTFDAVRKSCVTPYVQPIAPTPVSETHVVNTPTLTPGQFVKNPYNAEVFYVDADRCLRWVTDEKLAQKRFGSGWDQNTVEYNHTAVYRFCGSLK